MLTRVAFLVSYRNRLSGNDFEVNKSEKRLDCNPVPDLFGEVISYYKGVNSTDQPPIFNSHNDSSSTSSIPCNAEAEENGVISQEKLLLTNICYRRC